MRRMRKSPGVAKVGKLVQAQEQSRIWSNKMVRHLRTVAALVAVVVTQSAQSTTRPAVTIPFEGANHLVIVQAKVNNSRPLSFVLDTGADAAIVRMATAVELGLSLEGSVN